MASALSDVLGRMASAVLGADAPRRVGAFALRPEQHSAVLAAERALEEYGGALIADAPGSGKTVLALAIAARFPEVLILVPAALRAQWMHSADRAGVTARFETIEGLSQGRTPRSAALIIVDEAHHLRSPSTARYRALAKLAMQRRLLLLTATPVVNSLRDRDALLGLFLGSRAEQLTEAERTSVILRLASKQSSGMVVQHLAPLASNADVPGLGEALTRLPPPFPLADGGQATAILRLTLAFAWASSLAALDAALKRRIERGRTLDDQLAAGRWPARDALRAWILGDDATQLAFGFDTPDTGAVPPSARATLATHMGAVAELRSRIKAQVGIDVQARVQSLKDLLARVSPRRVVVLAQSAVTVRALYAAMRTEPGVVAITGNRVHTVAGRWQRDEVLRALGPEARAFESRDPRGIRLLIATDILAEGVEFQGASVLVHADPAWTPARLEQRVGRLAREGQREQVWVTQFEAPSTAIAMLQMRERLRLKSAARIQALRSPQAEAVLRERVATWAPLAGGDESALRIAAIRAPHCGFLALVREQGKARLLAGVRLNGRWRVRQSPSALLDAWPLNERETTAFTAMHVSCVRRVLSRWHRERLAAAMTTDARGVPESLLRALRARLEASITHSALGDRVGIAQSVSEVLQRVSLLRGRGAEHALKQLLRSSTRGDELIVKLRTIIADEPPETQKRPTPDSGAGRLAIEALLILVADALESRNSGPALS